MEKWVDVTGYKFHYQVSDGGRVRKQMPDGEWFYLKPYLSGRNRACVKMRTEDNKKVDVPVVWLVADAFLGGRRPGMNIVHKNGAKFDCSPWNLVFLTKRDSGKCSEGAARRTVLKVDREGKVVEIYRSTREAAKKNFISQTAVWNRCLGRVKDPYLLDGYNYQYEEQRRKLS